jgi:WD40 repeat protein
MTVVAWHPGGNLLATAGLDPRIRIWDVKTQRKIAQLEGHVEPVYFLSFHPDGDLLASAAVEGVLRLWQPSPGRLLMRLPVSGWAGFSREGQWPWVITPSDHEAQLWGIVPSQEYHTFINNFDESEGAPREGSISPDGTLLALGATDGVRLWDVAHGREAAWLRIGDTTATQFRADGRELLTCGTRGVLLRWPIAGNSKTEAGLHIGPPCPIPLPFAPSRIARVRANRTLAVVGEKPGQAALLDLDTGLIRSPEMPHAEAGFVSVSPDGVRLATSGWHSDRVKVWDAQTGGLLKEVVTGLMSRVYFTPDNRELIVARAWDFTFRDVKTLEVTRLMTREFGLYPGHVAFTADGKLMAMEMAPGLIHLKEITSGRTVAKLEDPQGDVSTWMSFTPDGTQLIVVAKYASAIHRWDLRAIRERLKFMNLDWDWPEYPVVNPAENLVGKKHRPLRVNVLAAQPAASSATPAAP